MQRPQKLVKICHVAMARDILADKQTDHHLVSVHYPLCILLAIVVLLSTFLIIQDGPIKTRLVWFVLLLQPFKIK